MTIKELIKKQFELWCKTRWIKALDKENKKYEKLKVKLNVQKYIIAELLRRYNKRYPE